VIPLVRKKSPTFIRDLIGHVAKYIIFGKTPNITTIFPKTPDLAMAYFETPKLTINVFSA